MYGRTRRSQPHVVRERTRGAHAHSGPNQAVGVMIFETNALKALYFQGVETKRFQHRVKLIVNVHRLTRRHPRQST